MWGRTICLECSISLCKTGVAGRHSHLGSQGSKDVCALYMCRCMVTTEGSRRTRMVPPYRVRMVKVVAQAYTPPVSVCSTLQTLRFACQLKNKCEYVYIYIYIYISITYRLYNERDTDTHRRTYWHMCIYSTGCTFLLVKQLSLHVEDRQTK